MGSEEDSSRILLEEGGECMKENRQQYKSKSKGELQMKRTIVILALVAAFVFAFSAVAGATYRGFTPVRSQAELDAGLLQGFISFPEARREMARNFGDGGAFSAETTAATLANTAHGGYVTSTTKCAVCHSAHRATGINDEAVQGSAASSASGTNLANVQNQAYLTAGSGTCEGCHVSTGSQASRLLVEWGPDGGGPHAAPRRGCLLCHNAGIHGLSGSRFNVMNVFMLGNTRNPNLQGSGGNSHPSIAGTPTRDMHIAAEIEDGRVLRGGTLDVPVNSPLPGVATAPTAGSTWWYNGARSLGPIGTVPSGFTGAPNANQFAAARSLATAYTCGESGCHMNTAMFNLNWGMGFERRDQVRGSETNPMASVTVGTQWVTGHIMPSVRTSGGGGGAAGSTQTSACGPCHGGHAAGFPTASTVPGQRDISRQAYGCDQCHDMVGVATNSTAWPHGNRNIRVYEWAKDGEQQENMMAGYNLWMYGGNIARANVSGMPISNNPNEALWPTAPDATGADRQQGPVFQGPTSRNTAFADQSWTVLTGVVQGRYGIPGQTEGMPGSYGVPGTGLTDGSCLKCHVAIDPASMATLGSMGADALRHAWRGGGDALNPTWDGIPIADREIESSRLFLYR